MWKRTLRDKPDMLHCYCRQGQDEEFVHRESLPLHYVVGRMSPFFIERLLKNDNSRAIWAIYFGPYTSNARGATRTGVAQVHIFVPFSIRVSL